MRKREREREIKFKELRYPKDGQSEQQRKLFVHIKLVDVKAMIISSVLLEQEEPGIVQQLQILKYLIEIWPKSQENL